MGTNNEYNKGYTCVSCGALRSNKSKAFCKPCYMKISGRESRQQGSRPARMPIARVLEGCVHHWVYPPPNGPVSEGYCLKCGEWDESSNSVQDTISVVNQRPRAK